MAPESRPATPALLGALKTGLVAAALLYLLFVLVAEPVHGLAASDSETAIVSLTVNAGIGIACDANQDSTYSSGETLSLPSITFTGDTGTYASSKQVTCKILTSNKTGWTLAWQIATGSGGRGTGKLISQFNDQFPAIGTGTYNNTFAFPSDAASAGWGGRVSSTSSGTLPAANMDFGTDTSAEKYARVATGSSVNIRTTTAQSQTNGDLVRVHFRAYVGASKVQPTGTYQATVTFTSSTNP